MYDVRWAPEADAGLDEILEDADEFLRAQLEAAILRIDTTLTNDAPHAGESRNPGTRILFESPLGIEYQFFEDRRLAYVVRLWRFETYD